MVDWWLNVRISELVVYPCTSPWYHVHCSQWCHVRCILWCKDQTQTFFFPTSYLITSCMHCSRHGEERIGALFVWRGLRHGKERIGALFVWRGSRQSEERIGALYKQSMNWGGGSCVLECAWQDRNIGLDRTMLKRGIHAAEWDKCIGIYAKKGCIKLIQMRLSIYVVSHEHKFLNSLWWTFSSIVAIRTTCSSASRCF